MLLKACINGARLPHEHVALPITAGELAQDVVAVSAAGAGAVHLHVKDDRGVDTLSAGSLATALCEVAAVAPGIPIGVTTGAWALPNPDERVAAIAAWTKRPQFASVNWHEDGADEAASALLQRGVGVEAGLWHDDAVAAWAASPVRDRCMRVLLELPDGLDEADTVRTANRMLEAVLATGSTTSVLLHGEGSSCWPALRRAAALGLATRIGLEDTLEMPDGSLAPDNAALVRAAAGILATAVR